MGLEKIGGGNSTKTLVQPSEPLSPSVGDEWVDTSYSNSAKKVYTGDGWETIVPGSHIRGGQKFTSDTNVDVSDKNEVVRIELTAGEGGTGTGVDDAVGNDIPEEALVPGSGGAGIVEVDLSPYTTIGVRPGSLEGAPSSEPDDFRDYYYSTGEGGNGTAIVDSNGDTIAVAGGGGGTLAITYVSKIPTTFAGAGGGEGGPTGSKASGIGGKYRREHIGGILRHFNTAFPGDGKLITKQEHATVVSQSISQGQPYVTKFK